MKTAGILFTALGAVLVLGAMFSFGWSLVHAINANEAYRVTIPTGGTFTTRVFPVDSSERVQLALLLEVQSTSVQENLADSSNRWRARYHFPVSYRVLDEQGREIKRQACDADWNRCGTRSKGDEQVDIHGGTVTVEHAFDKFRVPSPGRIQVEIGVGEDSRYGATARHAELIVYDGVVSHAGSITAGVAMILLGPLLLVVGILLLVIPASAGSGLPATAVSSEARNWAMFAHLAALLAYLGIPFGHIFGPLVVWLVKKEEDPFIAAHARESLNFQISMTIYFMIAFVLMFVLIGFALVFVLFALHLALTVLAALRANDGRFYRYPLTIRFL